MHKMVLTTTTALVMLALPVSALAVMNSVTVIYDAPGAAGTATLHINATGPSIKGEIPVIGAMDKCDKARKLAKSLCNACGGVLSTGGTCADIFEAPCTSIDPLYVDIEVRCIASQFRVNHAAGTDNLVVRPFPLGTPSLNAVIVKPSQCNELDVMTVASGPPIGQVSLQAPQTRLPALEGDVELIFAQGPPVQRAITSTTGKSSNQVLQDLLVQLPALGVSGSIASTNIRSWLPSEHVGNTLVMAGLQSKPQVGIKAPPGWTMVLEGASALPPPVPAVTGWGFAALIGLVLLAAAWFLRRGALRTT